MTPVNKACWIARETGRFRIHSALGHYLAVETRWRLTHCKITEEQVLGFSPTCDLNRSAKIPDAIRIANIATNDAMDSALSCETKPYRIFETGYWSLS